MNLIARRRLLSGAAVALGSVLAVTVGIVLAAPPAHAAGQTVNAHAVWTDDASQSPKAVVYSKQIGGPTTGKQPPIA